MSQFRRIETGREARKIKPGDIVRLLQPFRPERYCFRKYAFGVVAGVVRDDHRRSKNHQSLWNSKQVAQGNQPGWDELIVYLYEPDSSTVYMDEFGVKALFSFDSNEVALYKAI